MNTDEVELTLARIQSINYQRALRWHPNGLTEWSLSDWAVALAGEAGQLCNVVKKLNRVRDGLTGNKETEQELWLKLQGEIADVYLYLDLLASRLNYDLATIVRTKFNLKSQELGFPERL